MDRELVSLFVRSVQAQPGLMLTPNEIAALTGLSYRSVLRCIEDGELRAFRLRGRLRVDHDDYEEWKAGNLVEGRTPHEAYVGVQQLRKQRPAGSLRTLHEATLP